MERMGQPAEFELEPAQHDTATYGQWGDADYTGESSRSVEPMRNKSRSFDDGVRIGSKDR
jgi:hypothetical protein